MAKAQAEFIVIIGILVIALIAVYFAIQGFPPTSPVPPSISRKQTQIHESLISMVRKGADETLKVMEEHGGYPTEELLGPGDYQSPNFTIFMNQGVPYWAMCENNLVPSKSDVKKWFELSLKNYIEGHIGVISSNYRNVTFTMSKLNVSVNILSSPRKIDITVNLPTKVDGYAMQNPLYPYQTSIDTKFGEIYDFAKEFSGAQASKRFLEVFTIASIYLSNNASDGYPKLPTGGVLTMCGQTIYRTAQEIAYYLGEIAEYVTTQIVWWQSMPSNSDGPKVFAIKAGQDEIMQNTYNDLDIKMYLPDDFEFEASQPVVLTNTNPAYISGLWTGYKCLGTYHMGYTVSYPVIVRVEDPLSGHSFNFAVLVFVDNKNVTERINGVSQRIKKMVAGNCSDISAGQAECSGLQCAAKIKVTDENGQPLEGVTVTFGGCGLGTTGQTGEAEGNIKCGTQELILYKGSGYEHYSKSVSSSSINDTYILHSVHEFTAHFRRITIKKQCTLYDSSGAPYTAVLDACSQSATSCSTSECRVWKLYNYSTVDLVSSEKQYVISNMDSQDVSSECLESQDCEQCQQAGDSGSCMACYSDCLGSYVESVKIDYIPSGSYLANATTTFVDTSAASAKEIGGFLANFNLGSSQDIYFNIPETTPSSYRLADDVKTCLAQELRKCEIEPVSTEEPKNTTVISCSCSNLYDVLSGLTCTNRQQIAAKFCSCPSGGSCGQPCGGLDEPACTTCCVSSTSASEIVDLMLTGCNRRVICT